MNKKLLIGSCVAVALVAVVVIILFFVNDKQSKEYNYDLSKYVKVGKYKGPVVKQVLLIKMLA